MDIHFQKLKKIIKDSINSNVIFEPETDINGIHVPPSFNITSSNEPGWVQNTSFACKTQHHFSELCDFILMNYTTVLSNNHKIEIAIIMIESLTNYKYQNHLNGGYHFHAKDIYYKGQQLYELYFIPSGIPAWLHSTSSVPVATPLNWLKTLTSAGEVFSEYKPTNGGINYD